MKLIIAGGRDYVFIQNDIKFLNSLISDISEVVSGGAKGADRIGESWARCIPIPVKVFHAQWDKHGKAAGMIRNEVMAEYADAVVLFPGGKGTDNMYKQAVKHKLKIFDRRGV